MRVLVAGIGNMFQGDDAFGCEVAKVLAQRPLPGDVQVVDFGIRGLDLTYALLDAPDLTILVDAVSRAGNREQFIPLNQSLSRTLLRRRWMDTQ